MSRKLQTSKVKNERIRQIELEALGGTEQEILYAKNEFAARARTMDLESASELLQEKAKIRDDEIVQIQAPTTQKYSYCRVNLAHARKKIGHITRNRSQIRAGQAEKDYRTA